MNITKPMLAGNKYDSGSAIDTGTESGVEEAKALSYPLLATPKLDGIRCLVIDGALIDMEGPQVVSRRYKLIPNHFIRQEILKHYPIGCDGELIIKGGDFTDSSSGIMSRDGEPDFLYSIFDYVIDDLNKEYKDRLEDVKTLSKLPYYNEVKPVELNDYKELKAYEELTLQQGYEGIITRLPSGPYKCGRATKREQYLNKFKQFVHFEVEVIGFEEQMSNQNTAEEDAFGRTKRSTKKAGMKPKDTLGVFLVKSIEKVVFENKTIVEVGDELRVGSGKGLDHALRDAVWKNKSDYLGKLIRTKFQPIGVKDKPRFVTFDGWRDSDDLGAPDD